VSLRRLRLAGPFASLVLLLAAAAPARAADTVVAGNQIVQGNQCVGVLCADGEVFGQPPLTIKSGNTPGIRFVQTADGGFIPQTWDISGHETFFFVKDVTGNKTPVRVDLGAPSGSLHVSLSGDITTAAMLSQSVNPATVNVTGPADGGAILAALRGLTLSRYTLDADSRSVPHVGPAGGAFRAAFATGRTDNELASADMAGIALAAIKELDARVSTLALTPGATGATGATGANGAPASLAAADARIAALTKSNRKLTKGLAALRKQVKALARR